MEIALIDRVIVGAAAAVALILYYLIKSRSEIDLTRRMRKTDLHQRARETRSKLLRPKAVILALTRDGLELYVNGWIEEEAIRREIDSVDISVRSAKGALTLEQFRPRSDHGAIAIGYDDIASVAMLTRRDSVEWRAFSIAAKSDQSARIRLAEEIDPPAESIVDRIGAQSAVDHQFASEESAMLIESEIDLFRSSQRAEELKKRIPEKIIPHPGPISIELILLSDQSKVDRLDISIEITERDIERLKENLFIAMENSARSKLGLEPIEHRHLVFEI